MRVRESAANLARRSALPDRDLVQAFVGSFAVVRRAGAV
jgi:hypothetical protein